MHIFWIAGALLVAATLAVLLWPLLRARGGSGVSRDAINLAVHRDQLRDLEADMRAGTLAEDHYQSARSEIERRLLEDVEGPVAPAEKPRRSPWAALALAIAIPVCSVALYLAIGNPRALDPQAAGRSESDQGISAQQFQVLIERLASRLKEQPENPEGWAMLARSYAAVGRFAEAGAAYAEATARLPANAQLLADYADTLAMAQGRSLRGEPEKLIARALRADPRNLKALTLAGSAAFDRKDYSRAIAYWERAQKLEPADQEFAESLRAGLAEARSLAGSASTSPGKPAASERARVAAGRVGGVVRLAPELAAKVAPGDAVFIFARAASGPPMPLAVLRRQARELPVKFVLDDSMAMSPESRLSAHASVVVGARISKSGNATPRPGDLQGLSAAVKVGADNVNIVIDTELP